MKNNKINPDIKKEVIKITSIYNIVNAQCEGLYAEYNVLVDISDEKENQLFSILDDFQLNIREIYDIIEGSFDNIVEISDEECNEYELNEIQKYEKFILNNIPVLKDMLEDFSEKIKQFNFNE